MATISTLKQIHERFHQRRKLDDFFAVRDRMENLLHSIPCLNLGEIDPRAKANGVHVLSRYDARLASRDVPHSFGQDDVNTRT